MKTNETKTVIAKTENSTKISDIAKLSNCNVYTVKMYENYCKTKNIPIAKLTLKLSKQCRQKTRSILFKHVDNLLYVNARQQTKQPMLSNLKDNPNFAKDFMQFYKENYLNINFNANQMFTGQQDKQQNLQLFLDVIKTFLGEKKENKNKKKKIENKKKTTKTEKLENN